MKGLTFLTIPLFSRLLNTSDYGIYNTFIATEGIFYVLIGMAMHSNYKSARYKFGLSSEGVAEGEDFETYVSSTMVLIIINAIVWCVITICVSDCLTEWLLLDTRCLLLLVIYSTASAIIACFNAYVGLQYKYKSFIAVAGINAVCNIVLSILLMCTLFNDNRYLGRIIGITIPSALISIFIVFYFL